MDNANLATTALWVAMSPQHVLKESIVITMVLVHLLVTVTQATTARWQPLDQILRMMILVVYVRQVDTAVCSRTSLFVWNCLVIIHW